MMHVFSVRNLSYFFSFLQLFHLLHDSQWLLCMQHLDMQNMKISWENSQLTIICIEYLELSALFSLFCAIDIGQNGEITWEIPCYVVHWQSCFENGS